MCDENKSTLTQDDVTRLLAEIETNLHGVHDRLHTLFDAARDKQVTVSEEQLDKVVGRLALLEQGAVLVYKVQQPVEDPLAEIIAGLESVGLSLRMEKEGA